MLIYKILRRPEWDAFRAAGETDGAPVDLLFVLLVPEAATDEHLELLRQIASMLDRADIRDRLRQAQDSQGLYQTVVDAQNGL